MPVGLSTLTLTAAQTANVPTVQFTVGGATAGRNVRILATPWRAQGGPHQPWVQVAAALPTTAPSFTLTAAGAPLTLSYWDFIAVQDDPSALYAMELSPVVFVPITDVGGKSVWERCCDAVVAGITALNLPDVPAGKISKRWFPRVMQNMAPQPPCILVAPLGAESYPNSMNDRDDIAYPVLVVMVDGVNQESVGNMTRDLLWRERISRYFRYQRLAGVPEVNTTEIVPDVVLNPDAFGANLLVSAVLFRFVVRDRRGT